MNPFRKQLGFALPLVILIPVILIAAGEWAIIFTKPQLMKPLTGKLIEMNRMSGMR